MKSYAPIYRFGKGLQTRTAEDFGKPDEFRIFQNARTGKGLLTRRAGQVRAAYAGTDHAALNFNGTDEYVEVPLDTRVWTLPLRWSLKGVIKQDDNPVADEFILGYNGTGVGSLTIKLTSARILTVAFTDSAATTTTLTSSTALTAGTKYGFMVKRDTSTLTLYVGNTAEDTDTCSATNLGRTPTDNIQIGCHNDANFFDGDIDHLTLYASALPDNAEGLLRCYDPLAADVLACYTMEPDANALVTDWSRWGNTGKAFNAPTPATALCEQDAVVQGAAPFLDRQGKRRVLYVAGGNIYGAEMS